LNRSLYHKIKNTIAVLKEIIYDKLLENEEPFLQGLANKIDVILAGIRERRADEASQTDKLAESDYEVLLKTISDTAHDIIDFVGNKISDIREELWEYQSDIAPEDPRRDLYQELLQHLQRTLAALNDLKAVNEGIRLKKSTVALQELFEKWLATPSLRNAQIRVHLDKPEQLITTDVQKIRGFLDELVENSLKHNPQQTDLIIDLIGCVQDSLSFRYIKIPGQNRILHICVCDNGKGIPADKKEWIFQPLTTTAPGDEGSGLGMFGIRRTLTEMRGFIEETGKNGARFDIYIPLEDV
jgi:signal transduction histidine kinase